jgi:hypothetical protein
MMNSTIMICNNRPVIDEDNKSIFSLWCVINCCNTMEMIMLLFPILEFKYVEYSLKSMFDGLVCYGCVIVAVE